MTSGHRILVTGASGQLGRAVIAAAAARGVRAVGLERGELDVTDGDRVRRVVELYRPDSVIHCAAWTDVDGAEADPDGAMRVNEGGTRAVARACHQVGAHLVLVSTDYVFAGTEPEGYAELDAVDPINAYGVSKLAGEVAARQEIGDGVCIARTAWLFSDCPPNFVRTIASAALRGEELRVVDDQRGNPTWCGHLADALVTCALERLGGIHHLVDQPSVTWRVLAEAVVEELGAAVTVAPVGSSEFPRPARRAAVSVLRSTRADTPSMGSWRDGLHPTLADMRS